MDREAIDSLLDAGESYDDYRPEPIPAGVDAWTALPPNKSLNRTEVISYRSTEEPPSNITTRTRIRPTLQSVSPPPPPQLIPPIDPQTVDPVPIKPNPPSPKANNTQQVFVHTIPAPVNEGIRISKKLKLKTFRKCLYSDRKTEEQPLLPLRKQTQAIVSRPRLAKVVFDGEDIAQEAERIAREAKPSPQKLHKSINPPSPLPGMAQSWQETLNKVRLQIVLNSTSRLAQSTEFSSIKEQSMHMNPEDSPYSPRDKPLMIDMSKNTSSLGRLNPDTSTDFSKDFITKKTGYLKLAAMTPASDQQNQQSTLTSFRNILTHNKSVEPQQTRNKPFNIQTMKSTSYRDSREQLPASSSYRPRHPRPLPDPQYKKTEAAVPVDPIQIQEYGKQTVPVPRPHPLPNVGSFVSKKHEANLAQLQQQLTASTLFNVNRDREIGLQPQTVDPPRVRFIPSSHPSQRPQQSHQDIPPGQKMDIKYFYKQLVDRQ